MLYGVWLVEDRKASFKLQMSEMMLRSSLEVLEFYFIQLNIMSHLSIECSTQ